MFGIDSAGENTPPQLSHITPEFQMKNEKSQEKIWNKKMGRRTFLKTAVAPMTKCVRQYTFMT